MSHSPDADRLVAEAQRIAAQVVVAIIQRAFPQGRSDWMSERAAVQAAEPHILSALQQAQAPPQTCRVIHASGCDGECSEQAQPRPEIETLDYVAMLKKAKAHVQASPLYRRFIEHTPLENDIAVWMADFAQECAGAPRERGEWEPTNLIKHATALINAWDDDDDKVNDATFLEILEAVRESLPAPPAPPAEGRTE